MSSTIMEEPKSPTVLDIHLVRRDSLAINYAMSRLTEGDTLIIVRYPSNDPVCDATGFVLDTRFRVNSRKLFATGSRVFIKLLSQEYQQRHRERPEFKRLQIPADVVYLLDLTPSNDDDDALELVTSLSCPKGILYWSTLASCIPIPPEYVGGEDERAGGGRTQPSHQSPDTLNPPDTFIPPVDDSDEELSSLDRFEADTKRATEKSLKEVGVEVNGDSVASYKPMKELAPDYCVIRHCAGIERLLQLIEGKDARLDSAPKIWTVAMLANFFDCTSAVVDAVCSWIMSQKNGIMIEILPESCLRLGLVLRSGLITRAAFTVLVSEEAILIAGQKHDVPFQLFPTTEFGRLREDLDDDTINMVQHAGRSFSDRIDQQVRYLLDPNMTWFTRLSEFQKLQNFGFRRDSGNPEHAHTHDSLLKSIENLQDGFRHYFRGILFFCLLQQLSPNQVGLASKRRTWERHSSSIPVDVKHIYDSFAPPKRVLTRQFWDNLRICLWGTSFSDNNLIYQDLDDDNPLSRDKANLNVANSFQIKKMHMVDLKNLCKAFNLALFDYETQGAPLPDPIPNLTLANNPETGALGNRSVDERNERLIRFATAYDRDMKSRRDPSHVSYVAWSYRRVSNGHKPDPQSQFFGISPFMDEVREFLDNVCDAMVDQGEHHLFTVPETLICLTDDEYKYLPLFAGGFEDGTGGVYQDQLPPAEGGQSGPGPSYHTSFSTASAASSTMEWEMISPASRLESMTDSRSKDVDDGKAARINHWRTVFGASFDSRAFGGLGSNATAEVDGPGTERGKGQEEDREIEVNQQPVSADEVAGPTTSQPSNLDTLMSDDFFVEEEREGFDSCGEDVDFDFLSDAGDDDAATERGDGDSNDIV